MRHEKARGGGRLRRTRVSAPSTSSVNFQLNEGMTHTSILLLAQIIRGGSTWLWTLGLTPEVRDPGEISGGQKEGSYTCGCGQRGSRMTSILPSGCEGNASRSDGTACGSCYDAYQTIPFPCRPYPFWLVARCAVTCWRYL